MKILPGTFLLFLALFAAWTAMAGFFSPAFLLAGAMLCLFITRITWKPFFGRRVFFAPGLFFRRLFYFAAFIPFFVFAMVKASFDVARQAFSRKIDISPGTFVYPSTLSTKGAVVALANAVTLTPGTLTVDMSGGKLLTVHALSMDNGGRERLAADIRRLEEGIRRFTE